MPGQCVLAVLSGEIVAHRKRGEKGRVGGGGRQAQRATPSSCRRSHHCLGEQRWPAFAAAALATSPRAWSWGCGDGAQPLILGAVVVVTIPLPWGHGGGLLVPVRGEGCFGCTFCAPAFECMQHPRKREATLQQNFPSTPPEKQGFFHSIGWFHLRFPLSPSLCPSSLPPSLRPFLPLRAPGGERLAPFGAPPR